MPVALRIRTPCVRVSRCVCTSPLLTCLASRRASLEFSSHFSRGALRRRSGHSGAVNRTEPREDARQFCRVPALFRGTRCVAVAATRVPARYDG
eukprot:4630939-Lingulodinium_polyedra.AAC.1